MNRDDGSWPMRARQWALDHTCNIIYAIMQSATWLVFLHPISIIGGYKAAIKLNERNDNTEASSLGDRTGPECELQTVDTTLLEELREYYLPISYQTYTLADLHKDGVRKAGQVIDFGQDGRMLHDQVSLRWLAPLSKALKPAHILIVDDKEKRVIWSFRGTVVHKGAAIGDVLTDLLARATITDGDTFSDPGIQKFHHQGMWNAVLELHRECYKQLEDVWKSKHEYELVLLGHSLGAGVAALMAKKMAIDHGDCDNVKFPAKHARGLRVRCIGFATPAVMCKLSAAYMNNLVTSVVMNHDVVPRLSLGEVNRMIREDLVDGKPLVDHLQERGGASKVLGTMLGWSADRMTNVRKLFIGDDDTSANQVQKYWRRNHHSKVVRLYCPGTVIHLRPPHNPPGTRAANAPAPEDAQWEAAECKDTRPERVLLRESMFKDHALEAYAMGLKSVLGLVDLREEYSMLHSQWEVMSSAGGHCALSNEVSKLYLGAAPGGAIYGDKDRVEGKWEQVRIVWYDDKVAIRDCHMKWLTAKDDSTLTHEQWASGERHPRESQLWVLKVYLVQGQGGKLREVFSFSQGGRYVHYSGQGSNATLLRVERVVPPATALWAIEPVIHK